MYGNPFRDHVTAVRTLDAAGIPAPKAWTELHTRFTADTPSALDRYCDAVVTGDRKADLTVLRALALGETAAAPTHRATVDNALRAHVLRALRALYRPAQFENYTVAATLFDGAATAFTAAAGRIDPEAAAEELITAPEPQRQAWTAALLAAHNLDATLPVLAAAADLAGVPIRTPEATIALTVDATGVHRRRLWESWDSVGHRCGRWSALLAAGATLRALPDLANFQSYRRPEPMQEQWVSVGRGASQRRVVDPEDTPVGQD